MSTQVEICNLALTHLGMKPILSIDDGSVPAQRLKAVWDAALDGILRGHDWNFASRTESAAQLANETLPGWEYLYQYPANALMIRKIFNDGTAPGHPEKWEECLSSTNGKMIAAHISPAYLKYTAKVSDCTLFDALFVLAFSYQLAGILAKPLTGSEDMGGKMLAIASSLLSDARATNKSEGTERVEKRSSYLDAR